MKKEDQKVLANIEDEVLIQTVVDRNLVKKVAENLKDNDVVNLVHYRDLEDCFDPKFGFDEDAEREKIEEQVEKDFKVEYYVLHKDFDRYQLRDHLIDIARLHSHARIKNCSIRLSNFSNSVDFRLLYSPHYV